MKFDETLKPEWNPFAIFNKRYGLYAASDVDWQGVCETTLLFPTKESAESYLRQNAVCFDEDCIVVNLLEMAHNPTI